MVIPLVLFGLVLGAAVYWALRLYARSSAGSLATAVNSAAIGLTVLAAVLLLLRARVGFLLLAVAGGVYVVAHLHGLWRQRRGGGAGERTAAPIITRNLNVVRDAATGKLYGTMLAGRFKGRRLTELSLEQLLEIRAECRRDDPDATRLIEAILDQIHGPSWRTQAAAAPAAMSRDEAYEVLGLEPGADAAEVREAHRQLIMKLHGDQSGSEYMATKINQARDTLLGS